MKLIIILNNHNNKSSHNSNNNDSSNNSNNNNTTIMIMIIMMIIIIILTGNLRTKILDFRGFNSSIILISRGEIPISMGNLPESLSQAILVGIMLVGRLGAEHYEYMALAKETSVFA